MSTTPAVKISVVMAARNAEPYLSAAIESVLAQSVTDFEFLIVDDASSDGTREILAQYERLDSRIRLFRNPTNVGPYPSANRALAHARGAFIARHDADDASVPDRFAIQLDVLERDPGTALVTGLVESFEEENGQAHIIRPPAWQPKLEWELLFRNVVGAGAHVMFPRIFQSAPVTFPAKFLYAEDYGMWCRLCRAGRVVCPEEIVYRYRQHASSITHLHPTEQMACAADIQRDYQSHYVSADLTKENAAQLARFWLARDYAPLSANVRNVTAMFTELHANFLTYVECRYGTFERLALEAELDTVLRERVSYWLNRSIRFLDRQACGDLLSLAGARQETVKLSSRAIGQLASSALLKLRPGRGRDRRPPRS